MKRIEVTVYEDGTVVIFTNGVATFSGKISPEAHHNLHEAVRTVAHEVGVSEVKYNSTTALFVSEEEKEED